jgi:hypothetical protein
MSCRINNTAKRRENSADEVESESLEKREVRRSANTLGLWRAMKHEKRIACFVDTISGV